MSWVSATDDTTIGQDRLTGDIVGIITGEEGNERRHPDGWQA